jgi:LPXTG-site transpeptidase (sortase) family protein
MANSNLYLGKQKWLYSTARIFLILAIMASSMASFVLDTVPALADKAGVCGTPGEDGPAMISGVVNTYYPGTATVSAGATSIPVGTPRGGPAISAGDLLLVMQMQGADIDSSNTNNYGNGVGDGGTAVNTVTYPTGDPNYAGGHVGTNFSAGQYEYVVATGPVSGGSVPISSGLVNSYFFSNNAGGATQGQRRFQVVRVPQYSNATLVGVVTALRWDGSTGGIVSIDVAGQLDWNGQSINVSGQGFRGGGGRQLLGVGASSGFNWWDFRTLSTSTLNASKGEGFAGMPRYLNDNGILLDNGVEGFPNGSYGRGAPGNAGGGGTDGNPVINDENSGGGGGSNGGYGGMGGNAWRSGEVDGGYGGAPFPGSVSLITMGGGGGAGTTDDGTGLPNNDGFSSSGVAGGGIVFVRSGTIIGTGSVNANGASAPVDGDVTVVQNDGGGGGGAGGSVVVIARNGAGSVGTLTVTAAGGHGGDNWPGQAGMPARHGPGGGGGGGVVYTSGAVAAGSSVAGGVNGITTTADDPYGAMPGGAGILVTNVTSTDVPNTISGANCVPVSLTTVKTTSTPIVVAGTTATYTITVSNAAGAGGAAGVNISDTLYFNFTYASTDSVTLSGNAVRTAVIEPTVGTGTPSWGTFLIPGGGSVAITFTVNVNAATPPGTYQNPATTNFLDPVRTTETGTLTSTYDPLTSTGEDVTVLENNASFTITKVVTAIDTAGNGVLDNPGEVIEYRIDVVNTGDLDLTGVTVSDPLLQGANGTLNGPTESLSANGILNVDETWTYTGTYTVQQADIDNNGGGDGDIDNTATADSDQTAPQTGTASVPIVGPPAINVVKTIADITFVAPDVFRITYSIQVQNTGGVLLSNVQVVDDLAAAFPAPASYTVVSLLSGTFTVNASYDGNSDGGANPTHVNLLTGTNTLAPAASGVITLIVEINTSGATTNFTNTATASGTPPTGPAVQDSDSVSGPFFIDPALTKSVDPALASVGDVVTFTISVFNNGTVPAEGVVVTDPLPANLDFLNATSIDANTNLPRGTITLIPPRTVQVNIGTVGVDDEITIAVLTQVNSLGQPPVQNQATLVASAPPPGTSPDPLPNNSSSVTLQIAGGGGDDGGGGGERLTGFIPVTAGFAPGRVTDLSGLPVTRYHTLPNVTLEIPALKLELPVVGVPMKNKTWDVNWLLNQAGWLEGSAFPSFSGNSILTSHVTLPYGQPGPFADLHKLKEGDKIFVHAFGDLFIYEIKSVRKLNPNHPSILRHEDKPSLTLLTCADYYEKTESYLNQVVVKAVLVHSQPDLWWSDMR